MGVTAKYVGMIERGEKQVEETSSLGLLFQLKEGHPITPAALADSVAGDMLVAARDAARRIRTIPVLGWAHAGEAASYEELPDSWVSNVPTECRDEKAFAVVLEGESMEPKYSAGDLLILQPSYEAYSGCLAVCRFKDDGVVFRRVELLPEAVRLIALNPAYPTESYPRDAFSWIYPLWGRWTQVWK